MMGLRRILKVRHSRLYSPANQPCSDQRLERAVERHVVKTAELFTHIFNRKRLALALKERQEREPAWGGFGAHRVELFFAIVRLYLHNPTLA